jgi:hypothetical protein
MKLSSERYSGFKKCLDAFLDRNGPALVAAGLALATGVGCSELLHRRDNHSEVERIEPDSRFSPETTVVYPYAIDPEFELQSLPPPQNMSQI